MRPPLLARSWLLTVATSLLMTSSLVMAQGPATNMVVVDGCPSPAEGCEQATPDANNMLTCAQHYVLETTMEGDLITAGTQLKAACYSKCHTKFHKHKCPLTEPGCSGVAQFTSGAGTATLACNDVSKPVLVVNGDAMASGSITCDAAGGWKDNGSPVVTFATEDHHIVSHCKEAPNACDSFEDDCGGSCPPYLPAELQNNKLTCPQGGKLLVFGSRLFDTATCTADDGWHGQKGASDEHLIRFTVTPHSKIRAKCHTFSCVDKYKPLCELSSPNCMTLSGSNLKCNAGFLVIDSTLYNQAECSEEGWKANSKTLLPYTNSVPFPQLQATCQPYCDQSMVENICTTTGGWCTGPTYSMGGQLTCPANYHLIIDGKVTTTAVTCSDAGWVAAGTPQKLLDYATKTEKLKAQCVSKCEARFIDRTGNKPIYEDNKLSCRSSELLVLNGQEISSQAVECKKDVGWKDAAIPNGPALVPFTAYTTEKVTASCKPKPAPPPPVPDTTVPPATVPPTAAPTTPSPAANVTENSDADANVSSDDSDSTPFIAVIIILAMALLVVSVLLFLTCRKMKKNGGDEEQSKMSKSKSKSKNSSAKKKGGKKGAKQSKKSVKAKKGGKKSKKEKDNEDFVEDEEKGDQPATPSHQMSEPMSTVPLTLALGGPSNPEVMNV